MGEPQVLATGLTFPEGPVLAPDGETLYCVNIEAHVLSRLDLRTRALTRNWVTLPDDGRGNGATLGPDGALYVADVGARRIVRVGLPDGPVTTVADRTDMGIPLRGPNDLIFDADGAILFTDPAGSWDEPLGCVYRIAPGSRVAAKVADGLRFPNGLVLSPDGVILYVAETPLRRVLAFDLPTGARRVFAAVGEAGGPDGMRLAPDGSLYVALFGDGCVAEVSPSGEVVRRLPVPGGKNVTNLCFAPDARSIYVTEAESGTIVQVPL
ncbi:MAG: SMP-30/gluconolactonase/LRE family protein [Armatimonadetes bacterium]|nr:SMP-30/gluconolactonase/LRE family protein [Armatimonadota bacterium]